ncbi:protein of unknown function [uncultured Sphingopyxis sp.]|uniref:Uncharacterized protein n=1 Tax=uncultured Sphingopyxis sp. TaxID=310581 RepID=A0A1Y5PNZ5_9SPHN|nr:protein of unknown function [uncultured Sphingopyxis sp.]
MREHMRGDWQDTVADYQHIDIADLKRVPRRHQLVAGRSVRFQDSLEGHANLLVSFVGRLGSPIRVVDGIVPGDRAGQFKEQADLFF